MASRPLADDEAASVLRMLPDAEHLTLLPGSVREQDAPRRARPGAAPGSVAPGNADRPFAWMKVRRSDGREFRVRVNVETGRLAPLPGGGPNGGEPPNWLHGNALGETDAVGRHERHAGRRAAFRCRNCGRLEEAAHAGESETPHDCRVCGRGVVFGASPDEVFAHSHVQAHEGAKAHAASPDRELLYQDGGRLIKVPFGNVTVYKLLVPDNWEVLADADDARLAELGLTRDQVAEHAPVQAATPGRAPQHVTASASDGAGTTDGAG